MSVELRHLRYFLAVAEELSFSRAAERLYIAQPALSAQIRALEAQLGCELFSRTTRKVELTANGRLLLEDAADIVARADAAVAKLTAAARGEHGIVRVGFFEHGAGELGNEILARFAAARPSVEIELVSSETLIETQRQVRDHETDVAFAWLPLMYEELDAQPIRSERLVVAMHPEHALAASTTLRRAEVAREPIVAPWEQVPFELLAPWLRPYRPDGREPCDLNGKDHDECLATASRGVAVYSVPESVARFYARPNLVFVPVVDSEPGAIGVVWNRDVRNGAVAAFVEAAATAADATVRSSAIQSSGH